MGNLFSTQASEPPRQPVYNHWEPPPVYRPPANEARIPMREYRRPVGEARVPIREYQHRAAVLDDGPTIRTPCGPCKLFGRHTCSRNGACQFAIRSPTHPAPSVQSRKPCRFFAKGCCKKGDACGFSHDAASTKEMARAFNDTTVHQLVSPWRLPQTNSCDS